MRVRVTITPAGGGGGGEWVGILVLIGAIVGVLLCISPMIHSPHFRSFVWIMIKLIFILSIPFVAVAVVIFVIWALYKLFTEWL
jgi:hypothetical protein